jgi:hypothetical protein
MVAIAIIGILATLLLGAAAVASEVARDARTKSHIARLHTLLVERYDGYRNQRVELNTTWRSYTPQQLFDRTGIIFDSRLYEPAGRLAGLRETMKLEMPDRWSDLLNAPVPNPPVLIPASNGRPGVFLQRVPALYETYARTYNRLVDRVNEETGQVNTDEDIVANESAECLYLIIMNATGDGEAPGMFKPTDVGDTDGDGALEFVDGWGKPIAFIRWAPGFNSDAQLSIASLQRLRTKSGDAAVADAIIADHDPFDLFRLDNPTTTVTRGWRLLPLIVSGGGDEEIGEFFGPENVVANLDPYAKFGGGNYLGQPTDVELASDDINSHNVGALSRK